MRYEVRSIEPDGNTGRPGMLDWMPLAAQRKRPLTIITTARLFAVTPTARAITILAMALALGRNNPNSRLERSPMPTNAVIVTICHTYYSCTLCCREHDAGAPGTPRDPLYAEHLGHQNRHGVKTYRAHWCYDLDGQEPVRVPACSVLPAGEY